MLADFVAEFSSSNCIKGPPRIIISAKSIQTIPRVLNVDGSTNAQGSAVGVILKPLDETIIEQSLSFRFWTTNNDAKYKALIVGLKLAHKLRLSKIRVLSDSQLVVNQKKGEYVAKGTKKSTYLSKVRSS